MKLKPASFVVLAWCVAVAACAPVNETTSWQHLDNGAPPLAPAEANALLKKDIAACRRATDNTPVVDNFDGCMLGDGWMPEHKSPLSQLMKPLDGEQNNVPHDSVAQSVTAAPQNPATQIPPPQPQTASAQQRQQQTETISHDMNQDALVPAGGRVTVGVQGYQDRITFSNSGNDIDEHTNFFGGVAGYTYRDGDHNFWTLDGWLAHGYASTASPSGVVSGVPEYESELRLTLGHDYAYDAGWLSPYAGVGGRLFYDNGRGYTTDLGNGLFDTRTEQLYAPLGAIWRSLLPGNITMADTLEADGLLLGDINQRFSNLGGPNVTTTQKLFTGFGLRGEAMFGVPVANETVEVGPFVRYWNINNSSVNIQTCGGGGICEGFTEPYNRRLQIGLTARVSF